MNATRRAAPRRRLGGRHRSRPSARDALDVVTEITDALSIVAGRLVSATLDDRHGARGGNEAQISHATLPVRIVTLPGQPRSPRHDPTPPRADLHHVAGRRAGTRTRPGAADLQTLPCDTPSRRPTSSCRRAHPGRESGACRHGAAGSRRSRSSRRDGPWRGESSRAGTTSPRFPARRSQIGMGTRFGAAVAVTAAVGVCGAPLCSAVRLIDRRRDAMAPGPRAYPRCGPGHSNA